MQRERTRAGPCRLLAPAAALLVLLAAGAVRAPDGAAAGVVNPHDTDQPRFCLNCHTEEIYAKACGEPEGYCLLGGSVDGLCLTCHVREECCRPGLEHYRKLYLGRKGHASDVDAGSVPREFSPRTLPLHRGRITCRTCHLHAQLTPEGYKMLRLVRITSQGVDWSPLCKDCHREQ